MSDLDSDSDSVFNNTAEPPSEAGATNLLPLYQASSRTARLSRRLSYTSDKLFRDITSLFIAIQLRAQTEVSNNPNLLLEKQALAVNVFHAAAGADNCGFLNFVLKNYPNIGQTLVNSPDSTGNTPLHWAVARKQIAAAILLIQHGANRHWANQQSVTPWQIAEQRGILSRIIPNVSSNSIQAPVNDHKARL